MATKNSFFAFVQHANLNCESLGASGKKEILDLIAGLPEGSIVIDIIEGSEKPKLMPKQTPKSGAV